MLRVTILYFLQPLLLLFFMIDGSGLAKARCSNGRLTLHHTNEILRLILPPSLPTYLPTYLPIYQDFFGGSFDENDEEEGLCWCSERKDYKNCLLGLVLVERCLTNDELVKRTLKTYYDDEEFFQSVSMRAVFIRFLGASDGLFARRCGKPFYTNSFCGYGIREMLFFFFFLDWMGSIDK
ncbi:hypothetical protein K432DRAFT_230873 [Lepidopterella palustris CBS 459.81]|uniref:Uncharacterized protein n=1 Tax=Lepidopterella palustris CBS 459.81 TaxID=1314670 RepID=A0A8E2DXM3_9PEZI|nr:hypothetical protein K432DRAFT_230873 [Lepidopterella palustris CBS 459.81]